MSEPAADKPCAKCPWVSRDPEVKALTQTPELQANMKAGNWFCCHVNMGTCFGAKLLHEKHVRDSSR